MSLRSEIIAQAEWGIREQPQIHYAETRPIPLRTYKAHRVPLTTDCSGYVTCCYFAAGAPDPNGLEYSGQGFTGSLLGHLPEIPKAQAEAGDIVVFGPGEGDHAVILLEPGTVADPKIASHGTEANPSVQLLSQEIAGQPDPTRFLRGVPPAHVGPTPTWNVVNGNGEVIGARVKHPVRWALRHPRSFRKFWTVTFKRLT
jgi:hypothetical protein